VTGEYLDINTIKNKKGVKMKKKIISVLVTLGLVIMLVGVTAGCNSPKDPEVILSSTTSVRDSGLMDKLIPVFEQKSGYKMKTI
jgi:tungstate transport system substrate-binding protein